MACAEAVCYCAQTTTIVEQSCRDAGCTCTNGEADCGLQLAGGSVVSNIFSRFLGSATRNQVTVFRRLSNPPDGPFVHTKSEFFQEVRNQIVDNTLESVFEFAKDSLTDNSINAYEKQNGYNTYSGFMRLACTTVSSTNVCTNLTWRCCQKYAAVSSPVVVDSCSSTGKCSTADLQDCGTQECRCATYNGTVYHTCGESCLTTGRCDSQPASACAASSQACTCVTLRTYKCVNSAHGLSPFAAVPLILFFMAVL